MLLPLCKNPTGGHYFLYNFQWCADGLRRCLSLAFPTISNRRLGPGGAASSRVLLPPNDRTPVMDFRESR